MKLNSAFNINSIFYLFFNSLIVNEKSRDFSDCLQLKLEQPLLLHFTTNTKSSFYEKPAHSNP